MKGLLLNHLFQRFGFWLVAAAVLMGASVARAELHEIMKHYRGVRSLGMGGVVTTTGVYDEALFGNPATHLEAEVWKISILNVTAEANTNIVKDSKTIKGATGSSGGGDVLVKLADIIGRNEHARVAVLPGFYAPRFAGTGTAVGFGILASVQTNLFLRSNIDFDAQLVADVGPNLGLARKFLDDRLFVGVNGHLIYRAASDKTLQAASFLGGQKLKPSTLAGQGFGADADFGILIKPWPLAMVKPSVGASVNNAFRSNYGLFGSKKIIKSLDGPAATNERTVNFGGKLEFPDFLRVFSKPVVALEFHDWMVQDKKVSFWKKVHTGLELRLIRILNLRTGLNQGYWAAGLGIDLPLLKLDVASYGEELGSNAGHLEDRRYIARVCLDI